MGGRRLPRQNHGGVQGRRNREPYCNGTDRPGRLQGRGEPDHRSQTTVTFKGSLPGLAETLDRIHPRGPSHPDAGHASRRVGPIADRHRPTQGERRGAKGRRFSRGSGPRGRSPDGSSLQAHGSVSFQTTVSAEIGPALFPDAARRGAIIAFPVKIVRIRREVVRTQVLIGGTAARLQGRAMTKV